VNVRLLNERLQTSEVVPLEWFPHLERLDRQRLEFDVELGLDRLPDASGILSIRGARQYGKSTWLEQQLRSSALSGGPGSAFFLSGDHIGDAANLVSEIERLAAMFRPTAPHRRLFIDEITAIDGWEKALKRLVDGGELRDVLVVTTGSRARDLRRGVERLPGRKGKLARTSYLFPPLSFAAFSAKAATRFGADTVIAYLLSGGCPAAATELVQHGRLPEYVIEMVRDWIFGECAASGRDRGSLLAVWEALLRRGGTPIGQATIARDAGLANNTVAAGYLELLADLMCVGTALAWDESRSIANRRRPAKFPPTNLLAAIAFDTSGLRTVADFQALAPAIQGRWLEWLIAQEIWRRRAIHGELVPEQLAYWQAGQHELDYIVRPDLAIECKRGGSSAADFGWFPRTFPAAHLWIVGRDSFDGQKVHGRTFAEVLSDESW
jgi:uncharacterized protein